MNSIRGSDPYTITISVNNKPLEFEIDTGSGKTIMSEYIYSMSFQDIPFTSTFIELKTYSGNILHILGKLTVIIRHNDQVIDANIFVVAGRGPTLLGRDILSKLKLNWSQIHHIESVSQFPHQLKEKYPQLFSDKIGKLEGFKAKIYVKPDAKPKFCYPRKVPFALDDAVKQELKNLEEDGILKPVSYSDWASPLVIVPKPDGQVRICGDFKKTINPFTETEQYPMPNPD